MGALTMESLHKTYGEVRALRDLSMEVRPGEIFGFVGSNGAGKTTTMRIVLGVLASDAGEVRWPAGRSTSRCAGGSATCPRSAGSTRR